MPDQGAGIQLYDYTLQADTFSYSPMNPLAGIVRRILLGNTDGDDTWVISVSGQEVGRIYDLASSNQQVLLPSTKEGGPAVDIFDYCKMVLGRDLYYPVPQGQTLTIASVAGKKADIAIQFEEYPANAVGSTLINHPQGRHFLAPVWFSVAATPSAGGEIPFDTELGLSFVPSLFTGVSFPQGWTARVWDLFLQEAHSSTTWQTDYVAAIRNGQRLFTRDPVGGIPTSPTLEAFPAFDAVDPGTGPNLLAPIDYAPGYNCLWSLEVSGTLSTTDISAALQLGIVEYTEAQ